jgi:hypothetical protein
VTIPPVPRESLIVIGTVKKATPLRRHAVGSTCLEQFDIRADLHDGVEFGVDGVNTLRNARDCLARELATAQRGCERAPVCG